jgi:hypothetical protein
MTSDVSQWKKSWYAARRSSDIVVFDIDGGWVYPVTARDMTDRERRLYRKLFDKGRKK